uniref:Leader protease n=1 Tax=Panagrellus redivivus TaxID=6233 RepID=A0A7E4V970_PANRE
MANKKHPKKRVSDASRPPKNPKPKRPPPPPTRAEILDMTLGYSMYFPNTIPVTMSMLCCMPPGAAKLDFNGHCYNRAVAIGVICWNMKFSNHVEYYLYDPNDKSETYFNVIQCRLFGDKPPHCYPMGTYVAATGFIVGTTESSFMLTYYVVPITERQYNEYVFQARMVKFRCATDHVPKPLLPDAELYRVSSKYNIEHVRKDIAAKFLAENPGIAIGMAIVSAKPVKFKERSDSVLNYFRLCGQRLRKPVWPLENRHSTKPNGTSKPANANEASSTHPILNNANGTILSVPLKHAKACKCACTPNIDDYTKLVDFFLYVDIMNLKLAVSFYNNHAPVTVAMLDALPEKDRFKWGGLTFKTVRVIGKVVSKTIDRNEIHYILKDLETSAQYSVLQYIPEDTRILAPFTFGKNNFVEVVGDLHARTKKRNHDAVIADHVRMVDGECPFVQRFIDNAAYVCQYDDETIQMVLIANSFTDYCRYGKPPSKFPLSATFELINQFYTLMPIDFSCMFDALGRDSYLLGLFEL